MSRTPNSNRLRRRSGRVTVLLAVFAGLAVMAGVALAKTNTLNVAKVKVTNQTMVTTTESAAVNSKQRAVYTLTGDSKKHSECTMANTCLSFWLPVTVKSAKTKPLLAKGIKGKVSIWHRNGFFQVLLGGHPLYTFVEDAKKDTAVGEGIKSFGGVWHVVKVATKASPTKAPSSPPAMSPAPVLPGY
jgi:predicted lipoprotein with Yx(FWY)xxD motif